MTLEAVASIDRHSSNLAQVFARIKSENASSEITKQHKDLYLKHLHLPAYMNRSFGLAPHVHSPPLPLLHVGLELLRRRTNAMFKDINNDPSVLKLLDSAQKTASGIFFYSKGLNAVPLILSHGRGLRDTGSDVPS